MQSSDLDESHFKLMSEIDAFINTCKFTSDSQYVVAGGNGGLRVFNSSDGQLISSLYDLDHPIFSVDTANLSNTFAVGSQDGYLRVMKVAAKK